jgi:Zn-dependent protease
LGSPDPAHVFSILLVIFFAIGIHEFSHAKFAELAGDPTPRFYGRVTLNLFKHFEPIGSLLILINAFSGFGFGWGKPCPMDPRKMKNPRWDFFIAVIAGPISNLCQAVIYSLLFRIMLHQVGFQANPIMNFLVLGIEVNLSLAFFNLLPIGPLDGHWLLGLLMPEPARVSWFRFNRQMGMNILLAVIFLPRLLHQPGIELVIGPPVEAGFRLLTGLDLG